MLSFGFFLELCLDNHLVLAEGACSAQNAPIQLSVVLLDVRDLRDVLYVIRCQWKLLKNSPNYKSVHALV